MVIHRKRIIKSICILTVLLISIFLIANINNSTADSENEYSFKGTGNENYSLKEIIEDVNASLGYSYRTKDNLGNSLDTIKIIDNPVEKGYLGVYHVLINTTNGIFKTKLAKSTDLKNWTFKVNLANGSQPYIYSLSNGGFLVALEADNHGTGQVEKTWIRIYYYSNINRLYNGTYNRVFNVPHRLTPANSGAEGTPNIYSAILSPDLNNSIIDIGFHYFKDGIVDRQARGKLINFSIWTTKVENNVNNAIINLGVQGNIGDRDNIIYNNGNGSNKSYNIIEGQLIKGNWSSWRIFLYDWTTNSTSQLSIRTHKGSKAFANPSITKIRTPDGLPGIVVTLFIPKEGAAKGETGELIYYKYQKKNPTPTPTPTPIPTPTPNMYTIALVADAKPILGSNLNVLTDDFNQIIPQSPTGRVDAVVMIGDMNPINTGNVNTFAAYANSTAKTIPAFFVAGNHELNNIYDLPTIKSKFASYAYSPKPGPAGSRNTTYSFNLGNIHIVALNEYWDGNSNNICDWYKPSGGLNNDDSCFKYSTGDGGFVPEGLFSWLRNDLNNNNKKWTIVVGHEPLYPWGGHVGNSLDANVTNRNELENIFISKNVTAFIGGHTHKSGFRIVDNIFHANAGVIGDNVGNGDDFATIMYAYVNATGYFILDQKYENPTWSIPGMKELVKPP